jgi:hypothetical protein
MLILRPLFSGGKELDVLMRIRDADVSPIDRTSTKVPDDVRSALFKALARDPNLRWPNAAAFAEAIEDIVRRRRLQVGPSKLAAFVEKLGLVAGPDVEEETRETGAPTAQIESDTSLRIVVPDELRDPEPSRPSVPPSEPRSVSPTIYRVQREDGMIVGPLALPRLIEMFATGEVGGRCSIARENARFKPATAYPELARFMSSPALKWDADLPADAIDRGVLDPARLPTRLFHLAVRRETGALVLRDGTRKKRIFFVEGSPECVTSTEKRELLGEFLIHRGQVLRMELEMALAMLPRFGGRLGDALVGIGVLRPIELFRAVHDQTQERLLETFRMKKGEIAFARSVRSQEETFPLGVDTYELIGRGIRHGYRRGSRARVGAAGPPGNVPAARPRGPGDRGGHRQDDARQARRPAHGRRAGRSGRDLPGRLPRARVRAAAEPEVGRPSELHQDPVRPIVRPSSGGSPRGRVVRRGNVVEGT